jgi:hypothetical protein
MNAATSWRIARDTAGFALATSLMLACAVAQDLDAAPCRDADKGCLLRAIRSHAVHKLSAWEADRARPLPDRVGAAPPLMVEYLNLDNRLNDYPERPRAAKLDSAFLEDLKGAMADLPPPVLRLFERRLIGVYLVEDLGGTGFTDFTVDEADRPVAGYIVLDAAVLQHLTANAWASWKENTAFKPQDSYRLDARIESDAQDNRRNAIQYILLHELGHVLSIGGGVHPPWNIDPKEVDTSVQYPFYALSWKVDRAENKYATLFDAEFPQRKNVAYYFGAKLAGDEMLPTYVNLEQTNFPSLYAATRPGDDFAEAFASYVHAVLMQRPWQITISRDGASVRVFKSCWDEARCKEKRYLLEKMIQRPAASD